MHMHPRHSTWPLLLALACGPAMGQDSPPQTPDHSPATAPESTPPDGAHDEPNAEQNPELTDLSVHEATVERATRPEPAEIVRPYRAPPTRQATPGERVDQGSLRLANGLGVEAGARPLRPEGSFLLKRPGEIARLDNGSIAFLPAREPGTIGEPAMVVHKSEIWERLNAQLGESQRGLWVSLTGEVLVYHGRNYVLPMLLAFETDPTSDSAEPDTATPGAPEPPTQDSRLDDLVRDLESDRQSRRSIDPSARARGSGEASPEAAPEEGLAKLNGRMLARQRARLVRAAGGEWAIAIDNDGSTREPSTMRVLACSLLEQMEREAERLGDAWTFEISGTTLVVGQTVYLLPRMFVSLPQSDVRTGQ